MSKQRSICSLSALACGHDTLNSCLNFIKIDVIWNCKLCKLFPSPILLLSRVFITAKEMKPEQQLPNTEQTEEQRRVSDVICGGKSAGVRGASGSGPCSASPEGARFCGWLFHQAI